MALFSSKHAKKSPLEYKLLLQSNSTYFVKLVLLTLSGQRAAIGNAICRPSFFLPEILVFAHEQSLVHKYRILIRCLVLFFLISPFSYNPTTSS